MNRKELIRKLIIRELQGTYAELSGKGLEIFKKGELISCTIFNKTRAGIFLENELLVGINRTGEFLMLYKGRYKHDWRKAGGRWSRILKAYCKR